MYRKGLNNRDFWKKEFAVWTRCYVCGKSVIPVKGKCPNCKNVFKRDG